MKSKKDIFDLFRDNENKLDERPDDKLWDRLEGRLDQPEPRVSRRIGWPQWVSMAGVVLALIVMISAVSLMLQRPGGDEMHAEAKGIMPMELEEIGIYSDKGPNYSVAEYQKMLSRLNTSPILEGDPNKKIRIQKSVFASMSEKSKQQIASVNKIQESEKASLESKLATKPATKALADKAEPVTSITSTGSPVASNTAPSSVVTDEMKVEKEGEAVSYKTEEAVATYDNVAEKDLKSEEPGIANTYGYASPEADVAEMEDAELSEISINAMKNDISVGAATAQVGLQQFEWLLGKWEAPATNSYADADVAVTSSSGKKAKRKAADNASKEMSKGATEQTNLSVEEWKALDEFTIEGQGYLVVNGVTTFTESMQIKKIGNDLYYVLALDNTGQTVKYKLKTYTSEGAVFENDAVAFPNQVILQKHLNNNNFTTVLQNKAPAQINTEQQQYFQNRNAINNEQVRRVLNRAQE